jgi:hypothetical protein
MENIELRIGLAQGTGYRAVSVRQKRCKALLYSEHSYSIVLFRASAQTQAGEH